MFGPCTWLPQRHPAKKESEIPDCLTFVLSSVFSTRSLASELVSLLHDLVTETETGGAESAGESKEGLASSFTAWQEEVTTVACLWLRRAGPVVDSLQRQKVLEEQKLWVEAERARKQVAGGQQGTDVNVAELQAGGKDTGGGSVEDPLGQTLEGASPLGGSSLGAMSVDNLGCVVAVLCLLGGQFEGLYPGARVLCRISPEEHFSDVLSGWEDNPTVEATVLRLVTSGPKPARDDAERHGKGANSSLCAPADDMQTSGGTRAENAGAPQQAAVQAARPVFSSRVILRPPGCTRPIGSYEGLRDDAAAAVARVDFRVDQDRLCQLQQQQLAQQHQDIALRVENARLGSVNRRHGHGDGLADTRLEARAPGVRESDDVLPSDGGGGGGVSTLSTPPQQPQQQQQQPVSACKESVVVGVSREDRRSTPHAVTVPIDSVTLLHKGVPQVLMKTLAPHVKEILPGLKAMLGADTAFHGAYSGGGRMEFAAVYGKPRTIEDASYNATFGKPRLCVEATVEMDTAMY